MDWVLTAMSDDRSGIVEEIAAVITKHDGNWVKSSLSRLGGQFAGIVQFSTPASTDIAKLKTDLAELQQNGIIIQLEADNPHEQQTGVPAFIELTGMDHKGIVREITHLLRENGVTIEQFETDVFTASMAGEPMFAIEAQILLPVELSIEQLTKSVEAIAGDIMVDIKLQMDQAC